MTLFIAVLKTNCERSGIQFSLVFYLILLFVPPCFQHECPVRESKSNLSEPDSECAGDDVGARVEDQGLQQSARSTCPSQWDNRGVRW